MRRAEQNLGEKRVFLGSLSKKNNLRITYERLNLEEKAFISSTKFNRRQLLSRQNKLRHLQTQGNRGVNLEARPKTRTSFPDLAGGSEIRGYSNNLTLPYSRNGLRSPGEGKRPSTSLGKDGSGGIQQMKSDNINKFISQSNTSNNLPDFKDASTEKRHEIKTPLRSAKVEKDSRSKQVQRSNLHIGDIIAYSASYGKREKPQRRISSIDQEGDVKIEGNEISEPTNENKNFAVRKPTVWMNDLHSSASTEISVSDITRSLENENMNSTKHILNSYKNVFDPNDRSNNSASRQPSPRALSEKTVNESTRDACESIVVPWLKDSNCLASGSNSVTAETNTRTQADMTDTQSDELTSESLFITSSLQLSQTQETDGRNVSTTSQEPNDPNISRSTSSVPALVSRTPSWTGSKALPALGRIRRGSFCDVKTFTSGKVLDLLSSCEIPEAETKSSKQFLEVENENLKYCRYLRSVTPEEASLGAGDEALEIPLKYRPSKNIIIGHTKVNLMQ